MSVVESAAEKCMDQLEFKGQLDVVSRVGAITLIALYGAGFLVVTFHNATYGIVEFGLFRTRLLSAGIIFAIFLSLPFLEAAKIFGLFGFQRIGFPSPARLNEFVAFYVAVWGSTFFMRFLLGDFDFSLRFVLIFLCFPAISSVVFVSTEFNFWGKTIGIVMAIMLCLTSIVALVLIRQWNYLVIIGWFMLVGWLTFQMDSPIRNPEKLNQTNWVIVFFDLLMVFAFFATTLYPKIDPIFGGGHPTDIVLQFTNTSPVDNSQKMEVRLIDETDSGYYFIRTPEDRKAVFIPKSLISAVYFQVEKPLL
jgi:hypothetical protein